MTPADTKRLTALHDERHKLLRRRRLHGLNVYEEVRLQYALDEIDAIETAEAIERRKPDSFEELFARLYATLPGCSRCSRKATLRDWDRAESVFCDEHGGIHVSDLPWADIVREQEGRS